MDSIAANQVFLRDLFTGQPVDRHAFITTPTLPSLWEGPDNDVTTSTRPVAGWVPWVVEGYRRMVARQRALGDDGVPMARIATGTHVFAQALGCAVHTFSDNNPCAKPLVLSAAEADALPEPELWATPVFERIFELTRLVRQELGAEVPLGPCDMQSGFDTACLVWEKTEMSCAMADPDGQASVARLAGKCARLLQAFLVAWRREFPTCSPCHCPVVWTPPELGPWVSNDECVRPTLWLAVRKSGSPDKPSHAQVQHPEFDVVDFRTSGLPDFRTSGLPDCRKTDSCSHAKPAARFDDPRHFVSGCATPRTLGRIRARRSAPAARMGSVLA